MIPSLSLSLSLRGPVSLSLSFFFANSSHLLLHCIALTYNCHLFKQQLRKNERGFEKFIMNKKLALNT